MTQNNDHINARLNELYADYRQQLPERISYIAQQLEAYCTASPPPGALANLHYALHKLAGSGATFGHSELGEIARHWEHLTSALLKSSAPLSASQQQEMQSLLAQLSRAATFLDES
jgi:chemotaxis protein histidine kinase CheA